MDKKKPVLNSLTTNMRYKSNFSYSYQLVVGAFYCEAT